MPISQVTVHYITYLKQTMVQAMRSGLAGYQDISINRTKVDMDYPIDRNDYPAIVVKFYEQKIPNAGVGHVEMGVDPHSPDPTNPLYIPYHVRLYKGDIAFEIYGLSATDRDIMRDAVVEVVALGSVTTEGVAFQNRIQTLIGPSSHYITLNTDDISGFGETQMIAPWMPEDVLVYQATYRVPVLGQFYSLTPNTPTSYGLITQINTYPWSPSAGETQPPGVIDPAPWVQDQPLPPTS